MMDLAERRRTLQVDHAAMEKYDPYWKDLAFHGDRFSERPIAFLCDDEICLLSEDADKVRTGLKAFLARATEYEKRAQVEPTVASALAKAAKYVDSAGDIRVGQQVWNCLLFGLGEAGLQVVLTSGD